MSDPIKILAIDVGGTRLRATAIDEAGTVLHRAVSSAEPLRDGNSIAVLLDIINQAQDAVGGTLAGVVIGAPSILDSSRRGIVRSPNLPAFEGDGIADALEAACGTPPPFDAHPTPPTPGGGE